jgi:uncharacterized membrane protein YhhN
MGRWWGFGVYAVAVIVHLAALATGLHEIAAPTKAALMPALLLALLVGVPALRSEITLWAGIGVLLSWAGDVLLGAPGEVGFLVGLVCFLLAHVSYLMLYLRPLRRRRVPWWGLVFAVWWAVLIVVLVPHAGSLMIPLLLYGAVLCGAAAVSLGTTPVVAVGATVFLVSDTLLALKMFVPGFSFVQQDLVIMLFYTAGQGLIVAGAVLAARAGFRRAPVEGTLGA